MVPDDAVVITSRASAGRILCSRRRRRELAYVVSIGGAQDRRPAGLWRVRARLRLVFEDVLTRAEGGATRRHIERLIEFARHVDFTRGTVLVHCQAGVSRSSAAAAILLAVALGPGREVEARRQILRIRPEARPNLWMLELADEALETGGALVRAWRGDFRWPRV